MQEAADDRFGRLELTNRSFPPMYASKPGIRAVDLLSKELEGSVSDQESTSTDGQSRDGEPKSASGRREGVNSGTDSTASQHSGDDGDARQQIGTKRPRRRRMVSTKASAGSVEGAEVPGGSQHAGPDVAAASTATLGHGGDIDGDAIEDEGDTGDDTGSAPTGGKRKRRRTSGQGRPRRQWNRENARRSRMRKKLMVESMAVRMEELREQVVGMRAMIGRAGLEEDWRAWAAEHCPRHVLPSAASTEGLSGIQMPGEPGKLDQLAIADVARKAIRQARGGGAASSSSSGAAGEGRSGGESGAEASGSSAAGEQPPPLPVLPRSADGMVVVDGSLVPSSLMAPRELAQATQLHDTDYALIDSINTSRRHFLITDPLAPDNPIVFASSGFFALTGYPPQEVLGRNCRMLQGPETDPAAVDEIRAAVRRGADAHVVLLNYRRDGTPFWNDLFVAPLRDPEGRVVHFVGVQCEVTPSRARALLGLKAQSQASSRAAQRAKQALELVNRGMSTGGPASAAPVQTKPVLPAAASGGGNTAAPRAPALRLRRTGAAGEEQSLLSSSAGRGGLPAEVGGGSAATEAMGEVEEGGALTPLGREGASEAGHPAASTWSAVAGGAGALGPGAEPHESRFAPSTSTNSSVSGAGPGRKGSGAGQLQQEGPSALSDLDGEDMFRMAAAASSSGRPVDGTGVLPRGGGM